MPETTALTAADALNDPRWFVEDHDPRKGTLSFVRAERAAIAHEPFLDFRWKRAALARGEIAAGDLAALAPANAPPPKLNFIWHTSFCCSTLIAEALDVPGRNLSLKEPGVLVPVADVKRMAGQPNVPAAAPRLTELALRLLAKRFAAGESVTVKPSNFANALIGDAARLTQGRMLLLYSDLESFLVSIAKGGSALGKYVRLLFGSIAADGGPLRWQAREIFQMSDLELAAVVWHMQIEQFQRAARDIEPARVAALDCDAFLADPAGTLLALDTFFELGLGVAQVARVAGGPVLKRHAKAPQHAFDAAARRAQADDVRARLGADLKRAIDWSYEAFPTTPRGAPLGEVRVLTRA